MYGSQSHVGYTSLAINLRGSDVALILNKQRHQAAMCAIVVRPQQLSIIGAIPHISQRVWSSRVEGEQAKLTVTGGHEYL